MTGISTAADSLYVIEELVFNQQQFTLAELVACLRSNWGNNPEILGLNISTERIKVIRALCMKQPKFGQGKSEVDKHAYRLIEAFYDALQLVRKDPVHATNWDRLKLRYDVPGGRPFEILLAPGVGTFEQYNFSGSFAGATPDGRLAMSSIASDLSPSPLHSDLMPAQENNTSIMEGLESYAHDSINLLSDGAPADFNIPENFDQLSLTGAIKAFACGHGGNMLTITVSDPDTFINAQRSPADYNLLRVRMGGWTEFFISLFPSLQEQHKRRPLYK
jgi:pyruvate-formate lyase